VSKRFSKQRLVTPRVCRVFLGFTCAAILLTVGCSKKGEPSTSVVIEHEISPEPARVGPAAVTLRLTDASKPVTGARITIEADMTHPGMAPGFAEAQEQDPGLYRGRLEFSMAGDWVLLLHITLPGGEKLERQIDVRNVRPN